MGRRGHPGNAGDVDRRPLRGLMEKRSGEDAKSVNNDNKMVVEKGRQHGKQLCYRESCNQSRNGKLRGKGGRWGNAAPTHCRAGHIHGTPRTVRGKGEENAQGRHDLGQYLTLVVGYLRFQALANLTRPIMVQFSHTYIMGTTG